MMMIMLVVVVHTKRLPQVSPSSFILFREFCQTVFKFAVSKITQLLCCIPPAMPFCYCTRCRAAPAFASKVTNLLVCFKRVGKKTNIAVAWSGRKEEQTGKPNSLDNQLQTHTFLAHMVMLNFASLRTVMNREESQSQEMDHLIDKKTG